MNETATYLDQFARTTADVRIATVESRNDDGSYNVRYVDTKALDRAAKANPVDEFSLGSRIMVQMPSNSRAVIGANPVIVSRAPREQRGLSGTTPSATVDSFTGARITGIDPDPLILERGGEPGEQIIFGFGLTAAPTYSASVGDDPVLTEEAAPVITSTKITMTLSADADSPLGDFVLTIPGATPAAKALKIVEGPPLGPFLWYWTSALDFVRVNLANGSVMNTWPSPGGTREGAVTKDSTHIYAFTDSHLLKIDIAALTSQSFALDGAAIDRGAVVTATHIYYQKGRSATGVANLQPLVVVKCDLEGQNANEITLHATNRRYISNGMRLVGDIIYAATPISATNSGLLCRIDTSDDSFTVQALQGQQLWTAEVDGAHIVAHIGSGGSARARRYASATLVFDSVTDHDEPVFSDGGTGYSSEDGGTMFVAVSAVGAEPRLLRISFDPLTSNVVVMPGGYGSLAAGVAASGTTVYIVSASTNTVYRVARSDWSVTTVAAPQGRGPAVLTT